MAIVYPFFAGVATWNIAYVYGLLSGNEIKKFNVFSKAAGMKRIHDLRHQDKGFLLSFCKY
jgi:hypothetical protein